MYVVLCEVKGMQALKLNISETIDEITLKAYSLDKELKVVSEHLTDVYLLSELVDRYKVSIVQVVSNFGGTASTDLKFLETIKNKSSIKEIDIWTDVISFDSIYDYLNLEALSVYNSLQASLLLDISNFSNLITLTLNGNIATHGLSCSNLKTLIINNSSSISFVEKCMALRNLNIIHSAGIRLKDIASFFPNLKKLVLTQINMTTLVGIEGLKKIEELEINYCNKLQDISNIKHCKNLQKVYFEGIKKITDVTPLVELKHLKDLTFFKCGDIESLSFLNEMPSLENFLFTDTNIVDGDLTPCLRLKSAWSSFGKRHYNIDVRNLPH